MSQKNRDNEITARELQRRCNQRGSNLREDGWAGTLTRREMDIHFPALTPPAPEPPPPSQFTEQVVLSPNRRASPPVQPEYLVLHHCGGWAKDLNVNMGTLSHVLKPGTNASYHCLISWTGDRTVLVPYDQQAFHAGVSRWRNRTNLNAWSIGVAWGGDTVSGARRPNDSKMLIDVELASFLEWVRPLQAKHRWTPDEIITHRMIAPTRRNDTSDAVREQVIAAMRAAGMF